MTDAVASLLKPQADTMVSVIALVHNDEPVLRSFVRDLHGVLLARYEFFEILLVDLQSNDGTVAAIRELMEQLSNLRLIRLSSWADTEVGVTAALEHCIGDRVVLMDVYDDRPDDIPRLMAEADAGYDVVVAKPIAGIHERLGRRQFYRLASWALGKELNPEESDFRLMTRKVVAAITKIKHRRRHLRYFTALLGFSKTLVPCETRKATGKQRPRNGFFRSVLRSLDLLISNSATPLRAAAVLGVVASMASLTYLLYALVVSLIKEQLAEGWLTTSVMMSSMFFCLFIMLSVLAEYVARILEESQSRPLYFIEYEAESTVSNPRNKDVLNVTEAY